MSKQIKYTKEFKLKAIESYNTGKRPIDIWTENNILNKDSEYCGKILRVWRAKYAIGGEQAFDVIKGRKKLGIDKQDPKYLEAKIIYLEEENQFLRKLRAQRAE